MGTNVDIGARGARGSNRRHRAPRDRGYAIALTALLLVPLMAFTGLAVDVGGWYARAAAIQRATDAAALGGVAALPLGPSAASTAALNVAAANGFVNGVNGITVVATKVGPDQLRVTITDPDVPQFFTGLFRGNVSIARSSVAEYVPSVRMGSPRNFLGTSYLPAGSGLTGQSGLPAGAPQEFFWLSVNSPCAMAEDGDLLSSWYNAMWVSGSFAGCTRPRTPSPPSPQIVNPTYSPDGYIYGVKVDEGYTGGPVTIQVYDAAYCAASPPGATRPDFRLSNAVFTTVYTVRAPAPNPYDGSLLHQLSLGGSSETDANSGVCATPSSFTTGGYRGGWRDLYTIASPTPGDTYAIQVRTTDPTNGNRGSVNNFALRARTGAMGGGFQSCSADPFEVVPQLRPASTGISAANCPNVFALENMSVFANASGSAAEFFLASIGQEHSGKTMVIDLFDPGEGGDRLRLIDPNGNFVNFTYRIVPRYSGEAAPAGGFGPFANQSQVNISANGDQPGPNRLSNARYNDRQLQLIVQLPPDINVAYAGRTWWRVRYDFVSGTVTDRTTWSVTVRGDPVRLIE